MTRTEPLRRGGHLVDDVGRTVTWSVAEGRRGRRWRWVVGDGPGAAVAVHTLELDPAGRFSRLESARGGALLTLHREADGSAHGNRVSGAGVDHLVITAPAPDLVIVGTGPIGDAAFVAGLRFQADIASGPVLEVDDALAVRVGRFVVRRLGPRSYRLGGDAVARAIDVDEEGLPAPGPRSTSWSLEEG